MWMIKPLTRRFFLSSNLIASMGTIIKKQLYFIVPFDYRYEKTFRKKLKSIRNLSSKNLAVRSDYQLTELKKILTHCYENVPYYKNLFNELDFEPKKIGAADDINVIPVLTKETVIANFEKFQATNFFNQKKFSIATSGSTGKKLVLSVTDDVFKKEAAFILNTYKSHGGTLYDKPSIWLRRYVPQTETEPLFKYDFELKRMYMSAYHLNENNIENYIKIINQKKYHTLVGYPSSIYLLALYAEKKSLKLSYIKSIHVASEMMLPSWREKIIEVFGLIPYAHYGQIEKVALMHQKDQSGFYLNNLEYGYTELIKNGELHEIVGTGFINYAMPLIRYKTNDLAIGPRYENGILVGVESIVGRNDDFLTTIDGNRIPGVNFYSMINKNFPEITLFQIKQKFDRSIEFSFVSDSRVGKEFYSKIEYGLSARLGNVSIEIKQLDAILRNPNTNKLRAIISEV